MNMPTDENYRDVYTVFEKNHSEQREAMLAALPKAKLVAPRLKYRPAAAALAATLVVAIGVVGFVAIRPTPAYGLDGLRERLQSLRSLHLKGAMYQRTKTQFGVATIRFPVERYYERPLRSFSVSYGFGSKGNDNLAQVTRVYSVSDGERALLVLHDQKKAILTSPIDSLETELSVENALQISEIEQLMSGHPEDFERVGTERIDGSWCDIYQTKPVGAVGSSRRVWINPSNGLPVRLVATTRDSNGEDQTDYEYTEIRANVDPPAELFSFEVPDGYEVTEMKDVPKVRYIQPTGSCGGGDYSAALWQGLNIDGRAVLVCWSQWLRDKDKQVFFHDAPRLVLDGVPERPCTEQVLYETISGDIRWRWSLVAPDDGKLLGKNSLTIKFKHPKASLSLGVYPLVFSDARLTDIVERVQRRSLEPSGDFSAIKSIQQLREAIAKGPGRQPGSSK